ncbi:MAG: hypothetical protein ACKOX2_17950 [Microcystaceae cyanobacterium]
MVSPARSPFSPSGYQIAVLVPCHNEALTVSKVVQDFQRVLPQSQVYVYDNRSTDDRRCFRARRCAERRHRQTLR